MYHLDERGRLIKRTSKRGEKQPREEIIVVHIAACILNNVDQQQNVKYEEENGNGDADDGKNLADPRLLCQAAIVLAAGDASSNQTGDGKGDAGK